MKEQEVRLTNTSAASRLDRVAVNMGESQTEYGSPSPLKRDIQKPSSLEQLRQGWVAALTPEELRNPDTRSTVETAIALGIGPKRDTVIPREVVLANAALDEEARIAKVEVVLGRKLSKEEKRIFLLAHEVGEDEEGKDGTEAGVFNYTQKQIAKKARILSTHVQKDDLKEDSIGEAFSEEERRKVLEPGLAGAAVDRDEFVGFDPAVYAGTPLAPYADQLKSVGTAGGADNDRISAIIDRVTADAGIPSADKTAFLTELIRYKGLAEAADAARYTAGRGAGGRRGRGGGGEEVNLTGSQVTARLAELQFNEAVYTDATLQGIVREVLEKLNDPRAGLDYDFLNEKFRSIIRTPGEEAEKLRSSLHELMTIHDANRVTQLRLLGLYENIEMNPEQQAKLIQDVLDGNDDLIDEQFNALFAKADVNANSEFRDAIGQAGQLEIDSFLNTLTNAAETRTLPTGEALTSDQVEKLREKSRVFKQIKDLRQDLHTVAYAINSNLGIPELRKFLKHFEAKSQDVAFSMKGVSPMLHLYENAMHQVATENGGYITYEDMVDTVEGKRSKVENIVLKQAKLAREMKMPVFEGMKDYEILRAISFARGMGIVMGNFFEIVAEKGMSQGVPLTSWWANPIIKRMAPFRQFMRFRQGGKNLSALAFRLDEDKKGKVWTITDQKYFIENGVQDLLKQAIGRNKNVKRYLQGLNPLDVGSQWSQTAWRWAQDEEHFNLAMSRLLEHNLTNPLIGTGLWVEKQKGSLKSEENCKKIPDMIKAVNRDFGVHFDKKTTKGDLAKLLIEQNLRLSIKITPLTLFNSLTELRYAVLHNPLYVGAGQIKDPMGEDPSVMDGSNLQKDMNMLALLQEKLSLTRLTVYETWRDGGRTTAMPNLYREHADISRVIEEEFIEGHVPIDQRARLLALVENIQHAFTTVHAGEEKSPLEDLMENLKDKKWKVPYILGHDMPYDRIQFIKNGPDSVDRRGDDWEIVDATVPLIDKYVKSLSAVHKKEDLVAGLTEIHHQLRGHDISVADELVKNLAEATMLWFRKDIRAMLPAGFGTIWGFRGDASLAEVAGGREKMAWDRSDMDEFVNMLHGASIMDNAEGEHQIEELRKHTGSTKELLIFGFGGAGQTILSFMVLAYVFYMMKKQTEEKWS